MFVKRKSQQTKTWIRRTEAKVAYSSEKNFPQKPSNKKFFP